MKSYMFVIASDATGALAFHPKEDTVVGHLEAYGKAVHALTNNLKSLCEKTLRLHADWDFVAVIGFDRADEGLAELTDREIGRHLIQEVQAGNTDAELYVSRREMFPDEPVSEEPEANAGTSEEPAKKPRRRKAAPKKATE